MRPKDIQQIGDELAIKWEDGSENYVRLELLRKACPCAGCRGETDILGKYVDQLLERRFADGLISLAPQMTVSLRSQLNAESPPPR